MNQIEHLLRYKAWANDSVFDSLSRLPVEVAEAKRKIVFGSIVRTLHHTYAMDLVWRAHLEGVSHRYTTRNPDDCPSLGVLRGLQSEVDTWLIEYAASLSPELGTDIVEFEFIGGGVGRMSRFDILFHVVNHGTYHRGHVSSMMYEAGALPPTTDLPVYVRAANRDGHV